MATYEGRCTCGATRATLQSERAAAEFQPRSDAPTCGFCERHGGIWISDPAGRLELDPRNRTEMRTFASEAVRFFFCAACAELAYAAYAGLNGEVAVARRDLFSEIARSAKPVAFASFDGETDQQGRARRSANWTPVA